LARDLIIVRAGKRSLHSTWLEADTPRNWDLLLCPYEEIPPQPAGALIYDVIPGEKFRGLAVLLKEWLGWRDYRYVMFADDDIYATQETWSLFFERCAKFGARHAQPALSETSFFSHTVTVRNSEFVARRVSFVEVMLPCFRNDVMPEIPATFGLTAVGYGIDLLWSKMLSYKDVFVIDETPVLHTRRLRGHRDRELGRKWDVELFQFLRDNQIPWLMKTFAGILPSGEEIAEGHAAFLYRLFRGYEHVFAQDPRRFDETIRLQFAENPKS
jgi:hypothetical protein